MCTELGTELRFIVIKRKFSGNSQLSSRIKYNFYMSFFNSKGLLTFCVSSHSQQMWWFPPTPTRDPSCSKQVRKWWYSRVRKGSTCSWRTGRLLPFGPPITREDQARKICWEVWVACRAEVLTDWIHHRGVLIQAEWTLHRELLIPVESIQHPESSIVDTPEVCMYMCSYRNRPYALNYISITSALFRLSA
jgi:hypothetical protein